MRILVVEDEPLLRQGLCDLLKRAEHSVNAVSDGETAVHEGTRTLYDLVLLDLMLPRLDGIEVCRRLRMVRPGLPILVLTARGDEEDKVKVYRRGPTTTSPSPSGRGSSWRESTPSGGGLVSPRRNRSGSRRTAAAWISPAAKPAGTAGASP